MASVTRFPNSDGYYNEWLQGSGSDDLYTYIDETTADDDTTYIKGSNMSFPATKYFTVKFPTTPAVPSGATNIAVTVHFRAKKGGRLPENTKPFLRYSSTDEMGTLTSLSSWGDHSEEIDKPGGGSWTVSDVNSGNIEAGLEANGSDNRCTQLYIVISYTAGGPTAPAAPTSLRCDEAATQNSAGEPPAFDCIHNAGGTEEADRAQVQISTSTSFTSTVWDSGYETITSTSDGNRIPKVVYDGSYYFQSGTTYYWRIRLKNNSDGLDGTWSDDSTDPSEFIVTDREWQLDSAPLRQKILFDSEHTSIPSGYLATLSMKTGNRIIVATNGHFNESVQNCGGSSIVRYGGKTHWAYIGRYGTQDWEGDDIPYLSIWVQTLNHITGELGEPYLVAKTDTTYDIHYFPVIEVDNDGYLYIAYGCHYDDMRLTRSREPNVSGSLSGDPSANNWQDPTDSTPTNASIGEASDIYCTPPGAEEATYPILIRIPGISRIYVFYRDGIMGIGSSTAYKYRFNYSDDHGETWSSSYLFTCDTYNEDEDNQHYRWYMYGFKFDHKKLRLHMAWTHNHTIGGEVDMERGVWYAYCDYDDTDASSPDVGFNIVRKADGTILGRTGNNPPDYVEANAIVYADDEYSRIFIEDLVLDADGEPVVFWEQKFDDGSDSLYAEETNLCCAHWSSDIGSTGSWDICTISDQVNHKMAIRWSSFAGLTDRDGVMRLWFPVHAKTDWRFLPTGDVDDSGTVTPSTGTDNYACVDDGFTRIDTSTYITISGSGSKFSFDHDTEAPPGATEIESVTVHVYAAKTAANNPSGAVYLSDGTTDDSLSISYISSTSPEHASGTWDENPFTSSAWEASDLASLEFGFQTTTSYEAAVYTVFMECRYTRASDPAYGAAEIYELTSADNGETWAIREVTRNSLVGVPRFNSKHDLSGDVIEAIYSSGNNLLYIQGDPYGLVKPSGTDLRLYYGDSEIDRVANLFNLDESEIYFNLQSALAEGDQYPDEEYYVYYGDWDADDTPLSDPAEVFVAFFNFEEYESGTSMSGKDGWTASGGTWTIYASPPNHPNKVYAGQRSLQYVGVATETLTYTLGSGLSDIYVEGSLWIEGSDYCHIGLKDSSGTEFAVGIHPGAYAARYYNGSSWTTNTDVAAAKQVYHRIGLRVTSAGCTGYLDGKVVCEEITAITSVNDLVLSASADAFFDFITVSNESFQHAGGETTVTTGFDDAAGSSSSGHTSTYYSATDMAHGLTDKLNIWKMEITISATDSVAPAGSAQYFHFWVCNGDEYSPGSGDENIDTDQTMILYQGGATPASKTIVFDATRDPEDDTTETDNSTEYKAMPTIGRKAVKIDYYQAYNEGTCTLDQIKIYTEQHDVVLSLADIEGKGFYMNAALLGSGEFPFTAEGLVDDYFLRNSRQTAIEAAAVLQNRIQVPFEDIQTTLVEGSAHIESSRAMAANAMAVFENLVSQSPTGSFPLGWSGTTAALCGMRIETKAGRQATKIINLANDTAQMIPVLVPVEYGLEIDGDGKMVADWHQSITPGLAVQIETQVRLFGAGTMPFEAVHASSAFAKALAEWLQSDELSQRVVLAHVGALSSRGRMEIEDVALVSLRKIAPTEFGAQVQTDDEAALDWGTAMANASILPICFVSGLGAAQDVILDHRWTVALDGESNIESGVGVSGEVEMPLAELFEMVSIPIAPVSWTGGVLLTADRSAPMEYRGGVSSEGQVQAETLTSRIVDGEAAVTSTKGSRGSAQVPTSSLSGSRVSQQANIEASTGREATERTEIESGRGAESEDRALVESLSGREIEDQAPLDYTGGVLSTIDKTLPVSWVGAVSFGDVVPIEAGSSIESMAWVPVEICGETSVSLETILDYLSTSRVAKEAYLETQKAVTDALPALVEVGEERAAELGLKLAVGKTLEVIRKLPVEYQGGALVSSSSMFPLDWVLALDSAGSVCFERVGASSAVVLANLDVGKGAEGSSQALISTGSLAEIIRDVSVEFVKTTHHSKIGPLEYSLLTTANARAQIESCVARLFDKNLLTEWQVWSGLTVTTPIPLSWRSAIVAQHELPADYRSIMGVVHGRVLVDWGVQASAITQMTTEYGEIIGPTLDAIADWVGAVDAHATVEFGYVGHAASTMLAEFEFGEGRVFRSVLPFEVLDKMIAEWDMPMEWIGFGITLLMAINAHINVPGTAGAAVSVPSARRVIAELAGAEGLELRKAKARYAALKFAEEINSRVIGD